MLVLPGAVFASSDLADGTYKAEYLVLKAEDDSVSMANDYWEKPATIIVKNGKATVQLTINHSEWVTEFKVPSNGGHVDTTVVETLKADNKRIVEFAADVTAPIISKIHVTVAEIDYDHDYTIRLVFDMDSFELVKGTEKEPKPAVAEKPVATAKPAATTKPGQPVKPVTSATPVSEGSATATPGTTNSVSATPNAVKPEATEEADSETPAASASVKESEAGAEGAGATATPIAEETAANEQSTEETTKSANEGSGAAVAVEQGEQSSTIVASDKGAKGEVETLAAADETENINNKDSASGMNVWAPLVAVLLIACGAVYIWRRKRQ
ncbi:NEAT domain-containing protein [Paenibacillus sp. GSMTC-2017]|nr:NEAT domain-containing protein [Paenibacillus sp. GSMTC-2017]